MKPDDKIETVILAALHIAASRQSEDFHPSSYDALANREMHYDMLIDAIKDAANALE